MSFCTEHFLFRSSLICFHIFFESFFKMMILSVFIAQKFMFHYFHGHPLRDTSNLCISTFQTCYFFIIFAGTSDNYFVGIIVTSGRWEGWHFNLQNIRGMLILGPVSERVAINRKFLHVICHWAPIDIHRTMNRDPLWNGTQATPPQIDLLWEGVSWGYIPPPPPVIDTHAREPNGCRLHGCRHRRHVSLMWPCIIILVIIIINPPISQWKLNDKRDFFPLRLHFNHDYVKISDMPRKLLKEQNNTKIIKSRSLRWASLARLTIAPPPPPSNA